VRADYTWIRDRSYTESGADVLNLSVEGRTAKSFVIGIDGKLQQRVGDHGTIVGNIGVGYDTMDQKNTIVSSFAGAPGAAFTLSGIEAGRIVSRAGLGYVYQLMNGVDLAARYDTEHRTGLNNQTASVKVRWAF
jgi:autotransporter family porin